MASRLRANGRWSSVVNREFSAVIAAELGKNWSSFGASLILAEERLRGEFKGDQHVLVQIRKRFLEHVLRFGLGANIDTAAYEDAWSELTRLGFGNPLTEVSMIFFYVEFAMERKLDEGAIRDSIARMLECSERLREEGSSDSAKKFKEVAGKMLADLKF